MFSSAILWAKEVSWFSCMGRKSCQYQSWSLIAQARHCAHTTGSADSKWPVFFLHQLDYAIPYDIYSLPLADLERGEGVGL